MEEPEDARLPLAVRIGFAVAVAALFLGIVFALSRNVRVDVFQCKNTLLGEVAAPDGARRAVWFMRDCGRNTPRSTQLSLLPAGEPLGGGVGNLFVANLERPGQIEVRWASDDVLEVRVGKIRRAYRADPGVGQIRVLYGRVS